jgi:hypothetical protein
LGIFFIIKDPKSSGYLNPCHVNILMTKVKRTQPRGFLNILMVRDKQPGLFANVPPNHGWEEYTKKT